MNLRQVEIFCAVMRCRTVTAAAHELSISQPAVSNALKQLESHLGFLLFERIGGRGLYLLTGIMVFVVILVVNLIWRKLPPESMPATTQV